MIEGISQNQMSPSSTQTTVGQSANMTGTLSNMEVQIVDDPLSALEDSAEELTFCRDNSKQVKLADRKQKAGKAHVEELIEKFSKVTALYNNKDDNTRVRLLEVWRNSGKSFKELLKSLEQSGSHASSSYVFLKDQIEKQSDPHIKTELEKAADDLFKSKKSEILAAVNVVDLASSSHDLLDAHQLCTVYSDIINKFSSPSQMLDFIEEKFNKDKQDQGIEFMIKALAVDLSSVDHSKDVAALEVVGSNLAKVRVLNSSKNMLETTSMRMKNAVGADNLELSGKNMLSRLLNLSQSRFIQSTQVRTVYEELPKQDPEKEVILAQELLNACRNLSVELFDETEKRETVMDAVQKFVDESIEREDQWLENGGK
ncbi:MAG: TyeA family type III secretion system gatekeeper subunit [Succinivibrio sp.]